MFDWLNDAGSWISDLFSSAPEALGEAGGYNFLSNEVIGELPQLLGELGGYGAEGQSLITQALDYIKNNPGSTLKTAISALADSGRVPAGLLTALGGYLQGNAASEAADNTSDAIIEAARISADAARFRPVGVTTRFGQSNFGMDAAGNVTSAGYTLNPDIKALQDQFMAAAPGFQNQFLNSINRTAPMGTAADRMMTLGNQYLAQDPVAQAKKYYDDQQAIMATGRARDQAGALTGEFNRGTYGLATGATGMMGAANPRLEAMYNAQRQQDLEAAANATVGGQQYAQFGAGMVGSGGQMLRDMYGTQVASLDPYRTALGGATTLEGLGQNALDQSLNIAGRTSNAASGQLLANGLVNAANVQQNSATSPWGDLLQGAGNWLQNMNSPAQPNNQYGSSSNYLFNPFTGVKLP